MVNNYLIIPLEPLKKLKSLDLILLSKLVYLKKAFNELYPSNAYLSKELSMSVSSVQRGIAKLLQLKYITFIIENNNKRYIKLTIKTVKIFSLQTKKQNGFKLSYKNEALNNFYKMLDKK